MERIVRAFRRRLGRELVGEEGFSLLELVLASGLIAFVMSSMAFVGTVAFSDAGVARSRQVATGLANEAVEQVRALPYDNVAKGMLTTDMQSGGDPLITESGGEYRYAGERIPNSVTSADAPLAPHSATRTVDGVEYTVAVYATYLDDDTASRAFRVTARVSWTSALRAAGLKTVEAQTIVYSPSSGTGNGCGSTATHPYASPCAPYFFANAAASEGGVTMGAVANGGIAVTGLDIAEAMLQLPIGTSNMTIEQVESVNAEAKLSGVLLTHRSGAAASASGRLQATSGADSDPSQPKPTYETQSTGAQTSGTVTDSWSENTLTLTSSADASGTATATVVAGNANACGDAASPSAPQQDSLPCGNGTAYQSGTMTAALALTSFGNATIASIGPSGTAAGHTNYDAAPQTYSCPSTSGDGCISASARSVVGPVRVGGIFAAVSSLAPSGFDYLVRLDGFARTVVAEAGEGNANPSSTSSGTITYWNGVTYSTLSVGTGSSVTIPVADVTVTDASTNRTVSISATLRTGAVSTPACASPCANATAEAESPIVGDIRYTVVEAGSTVADFLVHVDLGTLTAHAEYEPSV